MQRARPPHSNKGFTGSEGEGASEISYLQCVAEPFFSIWPSIYPTSCIAVKKNYFKKFLKFIESKKYPHLEIDSRLVIYAFLKNDLKILNKSYTIYNYDFTGISSNYKKFSQNWWKKRNEAFDYMNFLTKKFKLNFRKGPDFLITKLINLLF